MSKSILQSKISDLKEEIEYEKENWKEYEEAYQDGSFYGAGSWFGHSDDCFDKGSEYGEYLAKIRTLELLEELEKEMT